jgi:DUF1680 family protein
MKKMIVGAAILALAVFCLSPADLGAAPAAPGSKVKVPDKIPSRAIPFDLTEVRLLDGPFREAMLRDQKYILELDPDRLLHNFRVTAGLPSTAQPLGGWEDPQEELRGHSVGHFLSACGLMYAATGDVRFKDKGDLIVAELAKVQAAMPSRGFNPGFLSAYPEEFFDRVDKRIRVWAPYYTLHKIMAGLLDMYLYTDNAQALDVVTKMAAWVKFRVDRLTEAEQQAALETEFGGMNEVLANLYAVTGNADHLATAFKFDHKKLFDQWAAGEDKLDGLHGNTQFPKVIGAFREYQLTGEKRYLDIARFFWDRVALHRSFVIGGNTNGERFFPIAEFSRNLGPSSTETCNTYNMLKLTRQLFGLEPAAAKMDFYERGLLNHILASQDPATGMVCYYVPLRPGAFKTYSTPNDSFWCCVGTGLENHAKYGDTIFFHDDRSLYLNLLIASELNWKEKGLVVRLETDFPEEGTAKLVFRAQNPVRLALKLRSPGWLAAALTVAVNGRREAVKPGPDGYAAIEREWKTGDAVEVRWPMGLRLEALPDDPKMIALLYGPVVLAGDLGREGLTEALRYGPNAPPVNRLTSVTVPAFLGEVKDVLDRVKPAPAAEGPLNFRTVGLGVPRDVRLHPLFEAADERYTVYWKVLSPAEWAARVSELAAKNARRLEVESRTLDAVDLDDERSEASHRLLAENATQGYFEGRRTREARNGWFSYDLGVPPDKPAVLVCTFVGGFGRPRTFDVLVDGEKIAAPTLEAAPGGLAELEYPLPGALTRGKQRVTVRFQSPPNGMTGSLFDIRTVRPAEAPK